MHLQITSASGNIHTRESFVSIQIITMDGQITILSGHMPILSAICPGVMHIEYIEGGKIYIEEYMVGSGIIDISPCLCSIMADTIDHTHGISDVEYFSLKRKEAQDIMDVYRKENGIPDPRRLIEIEHEFLKYTEMHRIAQRNTSSLGT